MRQPYHSWLYWIFLAAGCATEMSERQKGTATGAAIGAVAALVALLAQSDPTETTGSNVAVLVIGVLIVTAVIGTVVARRSKR